MATHDTDPQRASKAPVPEGEATTEPGDAAADDGSSAFAASLLADLAKAPLPAADVRETEGHAAAAYAVAPHRPPRAHDKTIENAAVVVATTTDPIPAPALGRDEPTVSASRGFTTVPSARSRSKRRVVVASVAGAIAAGALALAVVGLAKPDAPDATTPPPPPSASPSLTASPPPPPSSFPPPASAPVPATSPSAPAIVTAAPAARPAAKPPTTSRPAATTSPRPRPSATFAEPDRTF